MGDIVALWSCLFVCFVFMFVCLFVSAACVFLFRSVLSCLCASVFVPASVRSTHDATQNVLQYTNMLLSQFLILMTANIFPCIGVMGLCEAKELKYCN